MSNRVEALEAAYEKAMDKAHKLQAEKDAALAKVNDKYGDALRTANDKAAAVQKDLLDAQAAAGLVGRADAQAVAAELGLTLPE